MKVETPIPNQRNIFEWANIFNRAGEDQKDMMSPNELQFSSTAPVILNMLSDWHLGHAETHTDRVVQEVEVIAKKRNSFAVLLGDMIDAMGWNPGQLEESKQIPEQVMFFRALIDHLADKNSLLLYVRGDHEGWLMRQGYDTGREVIDRGVHATNGPTLMNVQVRDMHKRIGVAHRLPGHSIYNRNHPQRRALNVDGAFHGADMVISGHNHQKANQRVYVNEWGGNRQVELIALGAYKASDSWLKKMGYRPQGSEEMYGTSIKIDGDRGEVYVTDDIVKANK